MEINYDLADLYSEDTPIEVIRCESWGDLDYIYVYPDDSKPMFDVWCDFSEEDFIDGINIDELEEAYKDGVKMLWRMNNQLVQEIANEKGFTVVECKVGEGDHVHCFVSAPPKISVTQIVKYLKGISGNALLKEFPELRQYLWKGRLWNGSYFCETIGSTSEENILKYIERQKNCQL